MTPSWPASSTARSFSPALINSSAFNDPGKVTVKADGKLDITFEFSGKNNNASAADYSVVIRFADGTELTAL